jgi:hypothetical protein
MVFVRKALNISSGGDELDPGLDLVGLITLTGNRATRDYYIGGLERFPSGINHPLQVRAISPDSHSGHRRS